MELIKQELYEKALGQTPPLPYLILHHRNFQSRKSQSKKGYYFKLNNYGRGPSRFGRDNLKKPLRDRLYDEIAAIETEFERDYDEGKVDDAYVRVANEKIASREKRIGELRT